MYNSARNAKKRMRNEKAVLFRRISRRFFTDNIYLNFLHVIQLNFQMNSAHNLAGSLRLVSPFVEFPKVVDILEQFYIDNAHKHKDTSVR